jgi:hypothetical protein
MMGIVFSTDSLLIHTVYDITLILQVLHLIGVMTSHIVGLRPPTIPPLSTTRRRVFVLKQMARLAGT